MRKIALLITGLSVSLQLLAQNEDSLFIRRIANEILLNGKAYDNLRDLTKNIGARLTGSPNMVKAEKWGQAVLQKTGADKVWLQQCMVPHWVRGGKDEATAFYLNAPSKGIAVTRVSRPLDVIALGNSMGTGSKAILADILEVNSFDELEAKKDQVKGKIVFYNVKFNSTYIRPFEAYRDAVTYRGSGASRAAKYGALAVIVRSMSHSTDNNPHTGAMRYIDSLSANKIAAVAVGLKDADWMDEQLKKGPLSVSMKTNGHFLPDTIGHNVIGELTGSAYPDQYITVGGHLDSWDPAEGANDDGTGIAHTIEIMRAFKALGYQPKHTIRFVLFANEENGGRGGSKYAEEAKAKNEKHIYALESDAGGFAPRGFGFEVTDEQFAKIIQWKQLLEPYGAGNLVRGGDGSDIEPLRETLKTPTSGFLPDPQRYFDYHHARNDVFENVNKRELELGAISMAALIYLVDKYGL
jgi:carboxypeptidase Q